MSRFRVSLFPKLFSYWWETLERPHHRFLDQRITMKLHPDHFFAPLVFDGFDNKFERQMERFSRPWSEFLREWSVVKNNFQVSLDVQEFKPDEINVKLKNNFIIVEGKHEGKDEHGTISRHFVRKYMVPEQCDPEKVTSTLSSDGVLTINVPRRSEADKGERVIDIEHTGKSEDEAETKQAARG
ncbi:PREDICTED: protein lethal(2)essential for life-like [Dinoponera quadriceps]|uniref:Protein lethal(2)essential for life-like n=1 Tax=Dinoponera quadriceps TaxID=609295 RepID=A0A6P3X6Z3_DINQU|nr:PREDICTED: protein lethal(2)essential for life-like [Dinoponera quadriceps]